MKKFSFLAALFMMFAFVSCSSDDSDDENSDISNNPIVGTWQLESITQNGTPMPVQECELMSTISFHADGEISLENFNLNEETQECELSQNNNENYWEYLEDNNYKFTTIHEDGSETSSVVEITFLENNKLSIFIEDQSINSIYVKI